jgi:ATP-dependent protease ClpP protease subunit
LAAKTNKFWNFVQSDTENEATLYLDGEIASQESWWNDTINPAAFTRDLQALGNVDKIYVHISSGGGDVFAAYTIATRLKDNPAEIIAKTPWAASAATIILMAADKIMAPAGAVIMIHNPQVALCDYFESKDLTKMSETLETIKNSIIEWYCQKTGKDSKEISNLMDAETWWTGKEAYENGFVDELMFEEEPEQVIAKNKNTVVVNNVPINLKGYSVPEKIKKLFTQQAPDKTPKPEGITNISNINAEGGKEMEIKNMDELKKTYPEICNQIAEEAAKAERERIKNIEDITLAGYEELATKAKFEKPVSAETLGLQIIAEEKKSGEKFLSETKEDIENSNVNNIGTAPNGKVVNKKINPYGAIIDKVL